MKAIIKIVAIGSAAGALVLANLYMIGRPVDVSPILNGARDVGQLAGEDSGDAGAGTGHIEELTFVQTFSRPLFSQNRRKFEPPKPKPAPKPVEQAAKAPKKRNIPPPDFRVVGISINAAGSRALIVGGSSPDPQWFVEGEAIGDWKLVAIVGEGITVSQEDQEVLIGLYPEDQ